METGATNDGETVVAAVVEEESKVTVSEVEGEPAWIVEGLKSASATIIQSTEPVEAAPVPTIVLTIENKMEELHDENEHQNLEATQNLPTNYIGRKVKKKFGRKFYVGEITQFDPESKWYKVVYEDGDEEDLEFEEMEALLVPLAGSAPPTSKKRQSGVKGSKVSGKKSRTSEEHVQASADKPLEEKELVKDQFGAPEEAVQEQPKSIIESSATFVSESITVLDVRQEGMAVNGNIQGAKGHHLDLGIKLKGKKLRKLFDGKPFEGEVVGYNAKKKLYKITYEDGDKEELYWSELDPLLLPDPVEETVGPSMDENGQKENVTCSAKVEVNVQAEITVHVEKSRNVDTPLVDLSVPAVTSD